MYEQDGPIVTWRMNQPERRNALVAGAPMDEIVAAADRVHRDRDVRCVILTGNGSSFSAGGDLNVMKRQASDEMSLMDVRQDYRLGIQRITRALLDLEVPMIAAINGYAIGAGLDLACMCDIRIASETAKMAVSFIKVGIVPGDGGAWFLPRLIGMSRAAELMLTGDTFTAQQALEWNLVSRVVAPDDLMPTARDLAGRIVQNPAHSIRMTKRLLREGTRSSLETVLELSAAFQTMSHKTPDHTEAVNAMIEKRPPVFTGR